MTQQESASQSERAAALLGLPAAANEQELRSAYLKQVQAHPPDRDPELFEQIRDAYEHLRNPSTRASAVREGISPRAPLSALLQGTREKRAFAGSELWIQLLKERRA